MSLKKKIIFKAPLLTRSGYGEQSRFALRALRSRPDLFDIYIQPLTWGATSWIYTDDEERRFIDNAIEKTVAYVQGANQRADLSAPVFDISFQVTIPNEWEQLAPINIGYTAGIETTKVSAEWIQQAESVNKIIATSNHSRDTYRNTSWQAQHKVTGQVVDIEYPHGTPIHTVNYPAKKFEKLPDLGIDFEYDINFLTVAQWGPRKNLGNTISWFIQEFMDEEVGLVVKSNMAKNCHMDRVGVETQLKDLLKQYPDRKCKVYLLHGDLEDDEMHSLYSHPKISALLHLAHGEGFGLPLFEASYTGLPVIATGWSGQLDFLVDETGKDRFYNVSYDLNPVPPEVVWDGVLVKESLWAYPRAQSAKHQMRACYEDITNKTEGSIALDACNFAKEVQERFSQEKQYAAMVEPLLEYFKTEDEERWQGVLNQVVEYE